MKQKNCLQPILTDKKYLNKPDDFKVMYDSKYRKVGWLRAASRALGNSKLSGATVQVLLAVIAGKANSATIREYLSQDSQAVSKSLTKLLKIGAIEKTPSGEHYKLCDKHLMTCKPQAVSMTLPGLANKAA